MWNAIVASLLVIGLFGCEAKKKVHSFPGQDFEYVMAYKMNGHYGLVVEDDKISLNTIGEGERLLDEEEIELIDILNDPESSGNIGALCFEPHVGYVFYGNQEQIVAHTTICISCSQVRSQPPVDSWILSSKGSKRLESLEDMIFIY